MITFYQIYIPMLIPLDRSRTIHVYGAGQNHRHHSLLNSQMNLFILYLVFAFYTVRTNTDFQNIKKK